MAKVTGAPVDSDYQGYSKCMIDAVLFGSCKNHENSIFESWILTRSKSKMATMPRRRDGE